MAQEDLLHRTEFVKMLDSIISNKIKKNQGCSFAIDGKWGCGKSFILKKLEECLRGKGYFVVHYNCWQNDYYDEPLIAIMSVLVDSLNSLEIVSETIDAKRKNKTKNIAITLFKKISFMIVKNKLGLDFKEIGIDLENIKKSLSEALDKDKANLIEKSFDENLILKSGIATINQLLLQIKLEWKGVILIVDELDRCLPEYAIKVLERLHHICYDTEYDMFQFVQLIAMNKDELNDGISKAFGRAQITSNAIITSEPGNYSAKNYFNKAGSPSFGNYYLQKFVQMIIPVPNGKSTDIMPVLLNGFEKKFKSNNDGQIKLINDLLNVGFEQISMRVKEELIEFARTVHQITLDSADAAGKTLTQPSLITLCVELLDCLSKGICRTRIPSVQKKISHKHRYSILPFQEKEADSGIISLNIYFKGNYANNPEKFEEDIFNFFETSYNLYIEPQKPKENLNIIPSYINQLNLATDIFDSSKEKRFTFKMDNENTKVLWFYLEEDEKFKPENGIEPSQEDIDFVRAFRNTLDILT